MLKLVPGHCKLGACDTQQRQEHKAPAFAGMILSPVFGTAWRQILSFIRRRYYDYIGGLLWGLPRSPPIFYESAA